MPKGEVTPKASFKQGGLNLELFSKAVRVCNQGEGQITHGE